MDTLMKKVTAMVCGTLLFTGTASALPPYPNVFDGGNLWELTFYNDPTNNHQQWATQEICFLPYSIVGTSIQGVWFSTSFYDWNGLYYQEGDEVKMTGDYARDVGHDHMTLIHTTYDAPGIANAMAFKDWTEWREDRRYGFIIGWANAKLERVGKCPIPIDNIDITPIPPDILKMVEEEALQFSLKLPERLTVTGEVAAYPGQEGLESIDEYKARAGLQ